MPLNDSQFIRRLLRFRVVCPSCLLTLIVLGSSLLLQGCLLLDGPHTQRSRGSLSSALDRSGYSSGREQHAVPSRPYIAGQSSRPPKSAPPQVDFPPPPPVEFYLGYDAGREEGVAVVEAQEVPAVASGKADDGESFQVVTLSVLNQVTGHSYLEEGRVYCMAGEWRDKRLAIGIRTTFASMDFRRDWQYSDRLADPWSLDLGLDGKLYFAGREHFLQPYVGLSLAYGSLFWSYRYPLYDPDTGDQIRTDHVDYLRLGAIAGVFVRFSKEVRLAVEIRPDITFPGTTTSNGFINDLIDESKGAYAGLLLSVQLD